MIRFYSPDCQQNSAVNKMSICNVSSQGSSSASHHESVWHAHNSAWWEWRHMHTQRPAGSDGRAQTHTHSLPVTWGETRLILKPCHSKLSPEVSLRLKAGIVMFFVFFSTFLVSVYKANWHPEQLACWHKRWAQSNTVPQCRLTQAWLRYLIKD